MAAVVIRHERILFIAIGEGYRIHQNAVMLDDINSEIITGHCDTFGLWTETVSACLECCTINVIGRYVQQRQT